MKQKFLEANYIPYHQNGKNFLQKPIYDENGNKKYYININIHDFRDLKLKISLQELSNFLSFYDFPDFMYDGDVQFNLKDDTTFNVTLLHVESVEQTEKFFENVFNKLDCRKYDY